jgi:hypothetical protein
VTGRHAHASPSGRSTGDGGTAVDDQRGDPLIRPDTATTSVRGRASTQGAGGNTSTRFVTGPRARAGVQNGTEPGPDVSNPHPPVRRIGERGFGPVITSGARAVESTGMTMRFMVMMKATADSEAGTPPKAEDMAAAIAFNEELVAAGVLLAADGLKPSSAGVRVRFAGNERTVIDGPFAETKELVAGYWIVDVGSKQEAIEWFRRCPNTMGEGFEIEIRPFLGPEDFGDDVLTPGQREAVARMEATGAEQHG